MSLQEEVLSTEQHQGTEESSVDQRPPVAEFMEKMQTDEAKEIYKQRGRVTEFPNAWIKEKIGLRQLSVRGTGRGMG